MNTASKPEGSGVATGSALATTLGIFSDNAFIISMTCGWPLTTSAVSTAYTFPVGPTASARDLVKRPPTMSATTSPFLTPIKAMTSGTFQAGSNGGGLGGGVCDEAVVGAPSEKARSSDSAIVRMFFPYSIELQCSRRQ